MSSTREQNNVALFPACRQVANVQRVALAVSQKDDAAAARYFQTETRRVFAWAQAMGASSENARSQVDAFAVAVMAELNQMTFGIEDGAGAA
ncbi:MAG: DUF6074 family protein [Allorhizobium sp.]